MAKENICFSLSPFVFRTSALYREHIKSKLETTIKIDIHNIYVVEYREAVFKCWTSD
jgi:hypothetical protein